MANVTVPCLDLNDGHKMPIVGLGTWQGTLETDEGGIATNVENAISIGYRHIDTAQLYFAEAGVGKGIRAAIDKGMVRREDLFVTTKLWQTHSRREDVVRHLRKSLDKLQLGYVDLFLVHWPCPLKTMEENIFPKDDKGEVIYADDIDYLDTWKGMEEACDLGLTKSIGISNFNKRQIQRLLTNCKTRPVNNQVEVHLFFQNRNLVEFCQEEGISVTGFRNLQFLNVRSPDGPKTDIIEAIANRLGKTIQQVALKFQIQRGVAVIPKSSNEQRLKQNLEAVNIQLTDDDMKALEGLDTNKRTLDYIFTGSKYYPFTDSY
ncbi:aldo-keto reductase family 1 member C1-like [Liolophura sinensis]|uniref:aldo-keto reductase family 1 member C1-like n=1 Tax=Liolophura sinensis TaxID=3198878 RepID=UPI003158D8B9